MRKIDWVFLGLIGLSLTWGWFIGNHAAKLTRENKMLSSEISSISNRLDFEGNSLARRDSEIGQLYQRLNIVEERLGTIPRSTYEDYP